MDPTDDGASPWGDVPSSSSSVHKQSITTDGDSFGADQSESQAQGNNAASSSTAAKSGPGRSRGPMRRIPIHTTKLESVGDSLGPLGPLGDNAPTPLSPPEQPPAPPQKESTLILNQRGGQPDAATRASDIMNPEYDNDPEPSDRPRFPPPVQPPQQGGMQRNNQPSVSIEQAAKPTFDITVGDPHKVGDLTSSHIVYQVRTRTTSKAYRQPEFSVTRRYKDFLWLYNTLHANNPGVVVPPPPEKQAVGRFDSNFVESRRMALEKMLNKTAAHPTLQHDGDLKIFLESEAFNMDVKHKERKEPLLGESKGMFSGLGISVGSGSKFVEQDDWFHERRVYLDALENQLKALLKAMDTVVSQRKALAEAAGDFSGSLSSLSAVELSPSLSGPLAGLSDLQIRIKDIYERQALQDVLTLGITIDEYVRLIGSIKMAFEQRQKAFHSWQNADSEMQKKKQNQDKLLRQGKTQQDRINQLQAEVAEAERKVHQARLLFEDMGRLMRSELERFEREKVEDFKSGVETFLESAVEAQKELIELWETFLIQLDAEDDEQPYYKPPVIAPSTSGPSGPGSEHGNESISGETMAESTTTARNDENDE